MKQRVIVIFAIVLGLLVSPLSADAAFWHKWFKKKKNEPVVVIEQDPAKVQDYSRIIYNASYESHGMMNVYKYNDDYYFEIPVELMGRDMLVVNKLTYVPAELNRIGVNRGSDYQSMMVRFELDDDFSTVGMKRQYSMPDVSADDAIALSVADNYVAPLIEKFSVMGHSKDSTAVVIKVTDLFDGSNTVINNLFSNMNMELSNFMILI